MSPSGQKRLSFGKYKTESLGKTDRPNILAITVEQKERKRSGEEKYCGVIACRCICPPKLYKNDLEVARADLGIGPPFHIKELKCRSLFFLPCYMKLACVQ